MTQAMHTPGPYGYRPDRTIAAAGAPLARCYADRNEAANGQLFAAAPELLAALETLVWQVERTDDLPEEVEGMLSDARAAIAKAKGE